VGTAFREKKSTSAATVDTQTLVYTAAVVARAVSEP
jgi:hypothetical protein